LAQATAIGVESELELEIRRDLAILEGWIVGVGGRPDLAVAAFERALTFIDPATDPLSHAQATIYRAHMLGYLGHAEESVEQYTLAEHELVQLVGPHHPLVLDMRIAKGQAQMRLDDFAAARKELLEASTSLETLRGGPTTGTLAARAQAAWLLDQLGDCKGARAEYEPIIPLAHEHMPYPGPDLGDELNRRARICEYRSPEAVEFAREALALYHKAVGDEHVMVASGRTLLARTLYEAEQLEPALEEIEAALAIFAAVDPVGSEFVAAARALAMLIRHGLGEPSALEGIEDVLASLPTTHELAERLAALH
jgi:tetratricopeptide (TPR) repeat protein